MEETRNPKVAFGRCGSRQGGFHRLTYEEVGHAEASLGRKAAPRRNNATHVAPTGEALSVTIKSAVEDDARSTTPTALWTALETKHPLFSLRSRRGKLLATFASVVLLATMLCAVTGARGARRRELFGDAASAPSPLALQPAEREDAIEMETQLPSFHLGE